MEHSKSSKKERTKNRIEQLKGFYMHMGLYLIISILFTVSKVLRNVNNGEGFDEIFWDFNTYLVWIFWGIGVAYHASKLFKPNHFLGKNWEERKIREFMEEEQQQNRWN